MESPCFFFNYHNYFKEGQQTNLFCVCLQGYEVRKITAIDQDLGQPRGIGYTIVSGLSPIINLTFTAKRGKSIISYRNPTAITDKSHQARQSIAASMAMIAY